MKLDDDSTMRFGRHKGKKLGDVPCDWLLWAGDNITPEGAYAEFKEELLAYIAENRECLEKEKAGEL